jgi:hypothetical protein
MSSDSALSPVEAGAISLGGLVVTAAVAFVPAWAPEKEILTTIMGSAVTLGFMVANAIHSHGVSTAQAAQAAAVDPQAVTAAAVEAATDAAAQAYQAASDADVEAKVRAILAQLSAPAPVPPPVFVADPHPLADVQPAAGSVPPPA